MQIVSPGDKLQEVSEPIFWGKYHLLNFPRDLKTVHFSRLPYLPYHGYPI